MNRISVSGKTVTLKLKVRAKDAPAESAKFMGMTFQALQDMVSTKSCSKKNRELILIFCDYFQVMVSVTTSRNP